MATPRILYQHREHAHHPININLAMKLQQETASFNEKVALALTKLFSSMKVFWLIMGWMLLWIALNLTVSHFDPMPWPLLLCLASIPQLPLMIVIMVGQGLISKKQEMHLDEQYEATMKMYHDMAEIAEHLMAIDHELIKQTQDIERLQGK